MAGRPYVLKEDKTILRYILDGDYASMIAGNALWHQMEDREVCPGRTWQSLKNRFKKTIAIDFSRPEYGLSSDDKILLRNAATDKSKKESDTRLTKKRSQQSDKKQKHNTKNESASGVDSEEGESKTSVKDKEPVGASASTSNVSKNSIGRKRSVTPEDKEFYSLDMEWSDSD